MSYRDPNVFLGDPSFAPLYGSRKKRASTEDPEIPAWHSPETLAEDALAEGLPLDDLPDWSAWTDVWLDFRVINARTPLPADLDQVRPPMSNARVLKHLWPSKAEGWSLETWTWKPVSGPCLDSVTVARFTDPDAFRFSFAVSLDKPDKSARAALGRLAYLLPGMIRLFHDTTEYQRTIPLGQVINPEQTVVMKPHLRLPCTSQPESERSSATKVTYSLPVLRDAVRDPDGWFAGLPQWRETTFDGPFRQVNAFRVLLACASTGTTSFKDVEHWVRGGVDAMERDAWLVLNEADEAGESPEDVLVWDSGTILEWFAAVGGGRKRRDLAVAYRLAGLTPAQVGRWRSLLDQYGPKEFGMWVNAFEDANWDAADVTAAMRAVREDRIQRSASAYPSVGQSTASDVARWLFVTSKRAVAYLKAGITAAEAAGWEDAGEGPDEETLAVMSALRPTVSAPF